MTRYLKAWLTVSLRAADAHAPTFEVYEGRPDVTGQKWRYRERASNGKVTSPSEAYDSRSNAKTEAYVKAARISGAKVKVLGHAVDEE